MKTELEILQEYLGHDINPDERIAVADAYLLMQLAVKNAQNNNQVGN